MTIVRTLNLGMVVFGAKEEALLEQKWEEQKKYRNGKEGKLDKK